MKKKKVSSLKTKMLLISGICIGISFGIILTMFLLTKSSLEKRALESLATMTSEIDSKIEDLRKATVTASEAVANETRLLDYLDKQYEEGKVSEKNADVMAVRNKIFQDFNRSQPLNQIAAIYNISTDELFNFTDYNMQSQVTKDKLLELGVQKEENLSMYFWYPLQDNFLVERTYNEIRRDKVVIGSRRIYSSSKLSYPYIQIFSLEEETIYDCYKDEAEENGGYVYVLTKEGDLISCSDETILDSGIVPENIKLLAQGEPEQNVITKIDNRSFFVSVNIIGSQSNEYKGTEWITVIAMPKSQILQEINTLYIAIFFAMFFCIFLCAGMEMYLYKKFMTPISALSTAMEKVDQGDLQAYVENKNDNSETSQMLTRYNLMLKNINRSLEEQLQHEAEKQDLDMQVLTSQIDPHFLYNTLETIVWKSNEAQRPDIGRIASSLGRLYRLSVNGGEMWTTLEKEIEHVKYYIEIQRSRYEDEFEIEYKIDPEALTVKLPKLVLQPIVENIFLHAMPESEEKIKIRFEVKKDSYGAKIKIIDNGPGIERERLSVLKKRISGDITKDEWDKFQEKSSGIGLRNITARLDLYMKNNGSLKITSKKNIGTKVCVLIKNIEKDKNNP